MHKKETEYVNVLNALREMPFSVGKKLLIDFLRGENGNDSVKRNRLNKLALFGSMAYTEHELESLIENLIANGMMEYVPLNVNRFLKVLSLTQKGEIEIENPTLYTKKLGFASKPSVAEITELDKKIFSEFNFFLGSYDDFQKKAVISPKEKILCIAGAGSGKTSVLTKRIEFLSRFRSVDTANMLAITFTRKARAEMEARLLRAGCETNVETFNSFCEKILRKHNDIAYQKNFRVMSYRDKIRLMNFALISLGINNEQAVKKYFSYHQMRGKSSEELSAIFLNDCFFILDYCKSKKIELEDFSLNADNSQKENAKMIYGICRYIDNAMKKTGLRDYTDQLIDTLNLFSAHPETIPKFEHILVDEYQDVNSAQMELIQLLNPKNIFCVGDPRQSIFGWRGSRIKYILEFDEMHEDAEVIAITKNYRSSKQIVELTNKSVAGMGLPELETTLDSKADIRLIGFETEDAEFEFVMQTILNSKIKREEIFVLSRTNRQIVELSLLMKIKGIKHVVRSDELRKKAYALEGEVTLSTIHAIKGMEAQMVFVIGCTPNNFPCRTSEHPVVELVKIDEYDREVEEKRLFYVAMSRAKENLYLSYSGSKHTRFITDEMKEMLTVNSKNSFSKNQVQKKSENGSAFSNDLFSRLKLWRSEMAEMHSIPAYMILHDKTLIEIAQRKPSELSELSEIYGFGPAKIMRYGKEIVDLINGL